MQSIRLVFRYVIRQPRRAILTMLTFAVATFIFTVLAAIPGSIDMILKKTAETLRVYSYNADGRYLGVPARDCRTIERFPASSRACRWWCCAPRIRTRRKRCRRSRSTRTKSR